MIRGFLKGIFSFSCSKSLLSKYLHVFLWVLYFCIPIFSFVELCSEWAKETHDLGVDGVHFSLYDAHKHFGEIVFGSHGVFPNLTNLFLVANMSLVFLVVGGIET